MKAKQTPVYVPQWVFDSMAVFVWADLLLKIVCWCGDWTTNTSYLLSNQVAENHNHHFLYCAYSCRVVSKGLDRHQIRRMPATWKYELRRAIQNLKRKSFGAANYKLALAAAILPYTDGDSPLERNARILFNKSTDAQVEFLGSRDGYQSPEIG